MMANGWPMINDSQTTKLPHGFFINDVIIARGTCINMAKKAYGLSMRKGTLTTYCRKKTEHSMYTLLFYLNEENITPLSQCHKGTFSVSIRRFVLYFYGVKLALNFHQ